MFQFYYKLHDLWSSYYQIFSKLEKLMFTTNHFINLWRWGMKLSYSIEEDYEQGSLKIKSGKTQYLRLNMRVFIMFSEMFAST